MIYQIPFNDRWLTFWGGESIELIHHYGNQSQKFAFDFIKVDENGSFFRNEGRTNEDYFAFGEDIFAPADGIIIEAVDGMRDNAPSELNTFNVSGNYVMIKHSDVEYSILAHLRQSSVAVKIGEAVLAGQKIGECGNSGNSTDPHLHFHVQDYATFTSFNEKYERLDVALGVKIFFNDFNLKTGVVEKLVEEYSPVKGDVISR